MGKGGDKPARGEVSEVWADGRVVAVFKRVDRLIVCSLLIGLVQFGGGAALLKGVAANQAALTLPHQNEATRVALQRREEQPRRDGREEQPRKKEE